MADARESVARPGWRFAAAMGRCWCPEQAPWTTAAHPYEVEVCLNCDGVVAVWQRCLTGCSRDAPSERVCRDCLLGVCAQCAAPVANEQVLCGTCLVRRN